MADESLQAHKKMSILLLPGLNIRLETPEGKIVANIVTGELPRVQEPRWTQHRAYFTTPASTSTLMLVMTDKHPGGCGNDFALDDITFRECVKQITQVTALQKQLRQQNPRLHQNNLLLQNRHQKKLQLHHRRKISRPW